ncbi:MAG: arylsulfatase [Pirellulales bacterium]|nr:arylsulfatase [Pirellulales bacterium]
MAVFVRCAVAVSFLLMACRASRASEEAKRPNIIVILTDDMGFSDIGCYGGEIETPNLDVLAAGGLRFTQFYNTARCCPTRASLLTGLYPHQAGVGHMVDQRRYGDRPGYAGDLNNRCVTIAEAVRPAGYRTYMTGKWHVTPFRDKDRKHRRANWPLQRGFDRYYGTIKGGGSFYDPTGLVRDNQAISALADPEYKSEGEYYYTDAISDHAVRFIDDHADQHGEKPFFMYVAYTAAHWPMHAKEEAIAKYKGRYDAGYSAIRAARFAKAKELGVVDAAWQLSPQSDAWEEVENKEYETRCMEVYAAMVSEMDEGVGRIVAALKEQDQFENTLILYLQDNGGCAELMGRGEQDVATARADKPPLPPLAADYLQPDLVPKQTRDGHPVRQGIGVMPGAADTYAGYGRGWANVSNTPFREYKHWVHEGGISTPLLAHWPAGIAERGELRHEPGHLIDVMATCVELAGASYPTEREDESIHPLAGVSLRPAFVGESLNRKAPIFFEHEGNRAVRDSRWKLVAKGPAGAWELYDMLADRTELNDLAAEQPERVAAMIAQWEAWADRTGVLPWIWKPAYAAAQNR